MGTRDLLDRLLLVRAWGVVCADLVRAIDGGPVADVRCGPRNAVLLRELGVDAFSIDPVTRVIEIARREHSGVRFEVGSMMDRDLADESLARVLA